MVDRNHIDEASLSPDARRKLKSPTSFRLSLDVLNRLDRCQARLGGGRGDAVRHAITMLERVLDERDRGADIVIERPNGAARMILELM